MSELVIFNNEEFGAIRTLEINSKPWFVGKDIAEILGYSNASKAVSVHVDEEDKQFIMLDIADSQNGNVPVGQTKTTLINESGMYSLILLSKLPNAKKFKHWVTNEVLPSIRKHGAYMTEQTLEKALTSPDFLIQLATQLKQEKEKSKQLETTVNKQAELMERAKPLVCFANSVKTSKTAILVGEFAKILKQNGVDIGQNRLFQWFRDNGYLIKTGSSKNMPTQKSMEMGLFEIKETVISHADGHTSINRTPKITGKGQIFFVNLFLNKNNNERNDN